MTVPIVPTYGGHLITAIKQHTQNQGAGILSGEILSMHRKGGVSTTTVPVFRFADFGLLAGEIDVSNGLLSMVEDRDLESLPTDDDTLGLIVIAEHPVIADDVPIDPQVRLLRRLGTRVFILSGNERNRFADGCGEPHPGGLSEAGVTLVTALDRHGIVADVSHLSQSSFHDVITHCDRTPVIASHSNCYSLCPSPRNLRQEQMKAIAATGGLVGVSTYPTLISSDNPTVDLLVDHLRELADVIGTEHMALGADFVNYAADTVLSQLFGDSIGTRLYGETFEPVPGLETVADFPLLIEKMQQHFTVPEIKKIAYENYLRVLLRAASLRDGAA